MQAEILRPAALLAHFCILLWICIFKTYLFQLNWNLATPIAKTLLQCMSLLAPTAVPRHLLRNILNLANENALEDPVDDAVSELANRLSLADLDETNDPVLHRIISGFVRCTLAHNDDLERKVVAAIKDEITRVFDESDTLAFIELEKLIPHVEAVLSLDSLEAEERLYLMESLRRHHSNWGRYRLAKSYGRLALDYVESTYEPGHPSIARSQSILAGVLQDLRELEAARGLLSQALASDENSFETGHPSIATSQSNLALVLKNLGELEAARDLAKQAYQSFLYCFGPDHAYTKIAKEIWETI